MVSNNCKWLATITQGQHNQLAILQVLYITSFVYVCDHFIVLSESLKCLQK